MLRVTGYGAAAYVDYYGKRLMTESEWLYAVTTGNGAQKSSHGTASDPSGRMMHEADSGMQSGSSSVSSATETILPVPSPVLLSKPNECGVRGLNRGIGEWGVCSTVLSSEGKDRTSGFVIMSRLADDVENLLSSPSSVPRFLWEAFEEVGFRCAMSVEAGSS